MLVTVSELHDAIRLLADHLFRDQSAESNAKRAQLETILSPAEASAAAESAVVAESVTDASASLNPQVLPTQDS